MIHAVTFSKAENKFSKSCLVILKQQLTYKTAGGGAVFFKEVVHLETKWKRNVIIPRRIEQFN